jgi:hypothetical protein
MISKIPHISEIKSIQISLAIIFITLGIIAAIINFNFQVSSEQRDELLQLTKAIHHSDAINDNQTQHLIDITTNKIEQVFQTQQNNSKTLINLLLQNQVIIKQNQGIIKNTTSLNLNNTFVNKRHITDILNNLITTNQKLDKLINSSK